VNTAVLEGITMDWLRERQHPSVNECEIACLLKNSLSETVLKKHCARMPYKRFSPAAYTFLVTYFESLFRKIDFFNTHSPTHSPNSADTRLSRFLGSGRVTG